MRPMIVTPLFEEPTRPRNDETQHEHRGHRNSIMFVKLQLREYITGGDADKRAAAKRQRIDREDLRIGCEICS